MILYVSNHLLPNSAYYNKYKKCGIEIFLKILDIIEMNLLAMYVHRIYKNDFTHRFYVAQKDFERKN